MFDNKADKATRALLVSAHWKPQTAEEGQSLLDELAELVDTLGLEIVDRMLVKINAPQASYLVGAGKAQEIVDRAKAQGADVLIFDNELTPGQQRKWEELSGIAVIDREEVILDIFAGRARTKEARLQVDLARMEYSLPRLARAWGHLSRQQGGGLGGKGEGESQLETDRRLVRKRIDRLRAELEEVRGQRATQRKQRERLPVPHAAIVGYTNAGKSSLLKKFTGADVLVEDKLFATLDPTTRRIELPGGQALLLTDTVGFVRKLPHRLIESFKSTLEEAILADFLIHVLDSTQPEIFTFHRTTLNVLEELGAGEKPTLTVLNKVDLFGEDIREEALNPLRRHFPEALLISTRTGEGLEELRYRMADQLSGRVERMELLLPPERNDLLSGLHRQGQVISVEYEAAGGMRVQAVAPLTMQAVLEPYRVDAGGGGKNRGDQEDQARLEASGGALSEAQPEQAALSDA
jgi:GTP-binding protein HflX